VRFSLQLPTHCVERGAEFTSGEAVAAMARAAEAAGFDAVFVTDHPFPGDRWLAAGGHHALDPFVALSFAAAATRHIRLQTHVLVLPYRNPFLVAKAAASLDALSGGRLLLGVSAGYLKSEFRALGADFDARNSATDEAIVAIRRAWSEPGVTLSGRGFEASGNSMLPRPLQRPHPPIWVGGNSERAIRRAARLGDGWVPFPNTRELAGSQRTAVIASAADLRARLARLREHAAAAGRATPLDVCFAPLARGAASPHGSDAAGLREQVEDLSALGVTWLALSLPAPSRAAWCEAAARLGRNLHSGGPRG
jgi:probable F420-dependent oxidoreductase